MIAAWTLLAACLAGLVAGIRFKPGFETYLIALCFAGSLAAAVLVGKARQDRTGMKPRDAGVATFSAGMLAALLCLQYVPSGRWPTSVDAAVEKVKSALGVGTRRDLAYMSDEELILQHFGLAMEIRNSTGMYEGNGWLMSDCGDHSTSPDDCSGYIMAKLRDRLRAELPESERAGLALLEARLRRVKLPLYKFENAPMPQVVAVFQVQIDAQLPTTERPRLLLDEAHVTELVTTSSSMPVTLADALVRLAANSRASIQPKPPDVRLEPQFLPLSAELPRSTLLVPLFATGNGFSAQTRELLVDAAAWQATWRRIAAVTQTKLPLPAVDFSKHKVLVIALGVEDPNVTRYDATAGLDVVALGERHGVAHLTLYEVTTFDPCPQLNLGPRPLAVFLMPVTVTEIAFDHLGSRRACAAPAI